MVSAKEVPAQVGDTTDTTVPKRKKDYWLHWLAVIWGQRGKERQLADLGSQGIVWRLLTKVVITWSFCIRSLHAAQTSSHITVNTDYNRIILTTVHWTMTPLSLLYSTRVCQPVSYTQRSLSNERPNYFKKRQAQVQFSMSSTIGRSLWYD